ncbi:MAG: DUF192 domain-containing protein [Candidatus Latescibacterota bacterium]
MLVRNLTRDAVLGDRVGVAAASQERRRGLLGRDSLPAGGGLWIAPCEAVHTFCMRFSIDVLFLNRKLVVVKVREHMPPWRLSGSLRAHSTLELPAGTVQETGTRVGDQLAFAEEST